LTAITNPAPVNPRVPQLVLYAQHPQQTGCTVGKKRAQAWSEKHDAGGGIWLGRFSLMDVTLFEAPD
jgi:hypothetical protein